MKELIKEVLTNLNIKEEIIIDIPEHLNQGDYSTNIAFTLAKIEKISPFEIAQKLVEKILANNLEKKFDRVEASSPGFINFWINKDLYYKEIKIINKLKNNYGKPNANNNNLEKIQLEFISANPTGPLTMANGRGGFLGTAIGNVLEFIGHKVEREYYVNDTGNQILILGKSILAELGEFKIEDNFYKGDYIKKWADKNKTRILKNNNNPMRVGELAAQDYFKNIKKVIERDSDIKFDRYTSEKKDIHQLKFVDRALDILDKSGFVYELDGALWLKTTHFNDDKDRVLMTRDKYPTYFLADVGHYLETKERGFQKKITLLGADHHGYIARISSASKILGFNNVNFIVFQDVRLISKGSEIKMSKRAGTFVTLDELLKKVGNNVAKFLFLMITTGSRIDFDLALAKEKSLKNPVYYAEYAFVRILSVLKKATKIKSKNNPNLILLTTIEEHLLMKELAKFSDIIIDVGYDYDVTKLTRYILSLSRTFHNFYEKCRVIGVDHDLSLARLELIKATKIIFITSFSLLGIDTPKKM